MGEAVRIYCVAPLSLEGQPTVHQQRMPFEAYSHSTVEDRQFRLACWRVTADRRTAIEMSGGQAVVCVELEDMLDLSFVAQKGEIIHIVPGAQPQAEPQEHRVPLTAAMMEYLELV